MTELSSRGGESTRARYERAMREKTFDLIRRKTLAETTTEDFLKILKAGTSTTNHYLRRLHNLALGLGWLLTPVLSAKQWQPVKWRQKRAITWGEHQKIIESESNRERRLYYELLWEVGAAQTDAVLLTAENVDWNEKVLSYQRLKTKEWCSLRIGPSLEKLLKKLPAKGPLFPTLHETSASDRSAEFYRRRRLATIEGVSLHSYRYAWAERAYASGIAERFAQAALGHSSRAVHHAYSRGAKVICPALDASERIVHLSPTPIALAQSA